MPIAIGLLDYFGPDAEQDWVGIPPRVPV